MAIRPPKVGQAGFDAKSNCLGVLCECGEEFWFEVPQEPVPIDQDDAYDAGLGPRYVNKAAGPAQSRCPACQQAWVVQLPDGTVVKATESAEREFGVDVYAPFRLRVVSDDAAQAEVQAKKQLLLVLRDLADVLRERDSSFHEDADLVVGNAWPGDGAPAPVRALAANGVDNTAQAVVLEALKHQRHVKEVEPEAMGNADLSLKIGATTYHLLLRRID